MNKTATNMETVAKALYPAAIDLGTRMHDRQSALNQLTSQMRHVVSLNDPVARREIQAELDHTVGLLVVAHWMRMFSEAVPDAYWSWYIDTDDRRRLRAYRHLARSAREGLGHERSKRDRRQFDAVMASSDPLPGVLVAGDRLTIEPTVGNALGVFMEQVRSKLIVKLHDVGRV